MKEDKRKFTIGSILIPLIAAVIGLIPFIYDKFSGKTNERLETNIDMSVEKKALAIKAYQEGMSLYNNGNYEEAKIFLKAAINNGDVLDAYYPLAECYRAGGNNNFEKYKFYCEVGVEKGDLKCHYGIWNYYAFLASEKDEIKAHKHAYKGFEEIKKHAESGDVFWQVRLGFLYSMYKKDSGKALYWYQKAAQQNDALAQNNLGCLYQKGEGVEKDLEKAFYWYQMAAEQNNALAQHNLGCLYLKGEGVEKDLEKAFYWYQMAAEQNDADAQVSVGYCYRHGLGIAQDYKKAMYWYQKAAEQNSAAAQNNIGVLYHYGFGVKVDFERAKYWYQKAERQGHKLAIENLNEIQ